MLKRETENFLVRDLIRLLETLPANQEVVLDVPDSPYLRMFNGKTSIAKDGKEPLVCLHVQELPEDDE